MSVQFLGQVSPISSSKLKRSKLQGHLIDVIIDDIEPLQPSTDRPARRNFLNFVNVPPIATYPSPLQLQPI